MKLWHKSNGKVFLCPAHLDTLEEYKSFVKQAYGTLVGVKFFSARNRREAEFTAARK